MYPKGAQYADPLRGYSGGGAGRDLAGTLQDRVVHLVEAVVDLASEDYHPLAKKAKDTAAGAVLIAAMAAAVIGVIIFGPKLLAVFGLI